MNQTMEQVQVERDLGIARAEGAANRQVPGWSELAFRFLRRFAMTAQEFTGEDVTEAFNKTDFTKPKDDRAWGGVYQRAVREGVMEKHPTKTRPRARGHCAPAPVWVSKIFVRTGQQMDLGW